MKLEQCTLCDAECVPYFEGEPGDYIMLSEDTIVVGPEGYRMCHMCWLTQHVCLDCKINTHVIGEYYRIHNDLWGECCSWWSRHAVYWLCGATARSNTNV